MVPTRPGATGQRPAVWLVLSSAEPYGSTTTNGSTTTKGGIVLHAFIRFNRGILAMPVYWKVWLAFLVGANHRGSRSMTTLEQKNIEAMS